MDRLVKEGSLIHMPLIHVHDVPDVPLIRPWRIHNTCVTHDIFPGCKCFENLT